LSESELKDIREFSEWGGVYSVNSKILEILIRTIKQKYEDKLMTILREQLIEEIQQIPDERLPEIFDLIHFFRLGLDNVPAKSTDISKFAGAWSDMSDTQFAAYETEWQRRRQQAFVR